MSIIVQVDAAELASVQRTLNATNAQIDRAAVRSVNKTVAWAASTGRRALAKDSDLPLKTLRTRVRQRKAASGVLRGSAWFGTAPVKAIYAGAPRQGLKGVTVRSHSFHGAFVARMPSGHLGIFKRRGAARLPIEEQRIALNQSEAAFSAIEAQSPERLRSIYAQELNYELNVRGTG